MERWTRVISFLLSLCLLGQAPALAREGRGATLVLDAGHGGEDGGAVSLTGTPESRINLSIVLKMEEILGLYGVSPRLLRREDISLHEPSAGTLREKKRSDLHRRAELVEEVPNAVLVSIHQNAYPGGSCRGAQVFYGRQEGSAALAEEVQTLLCTALDPENHRTAKPIGSGVYLMEHVTCPAILVECGFLTDPEEAAKLETGEYQTKLALVLSAALLRSGQFDCRDTDTNEEGIPQYESKNSVLLYRMWERAS